MRLLAPLYYKRYVTCYVKIMQLIIKFQNTTSAPPRSLPLPHHESCIHDPCERYMTYRYREGRLMFCSVQEEAVKEGKGPWGGGVQSLKEIRGGHAGSGTQLLRRHRFAGQVCLNEAHLSSFKSPFSGSAINMHVCMYVFTMEVATSDRLQTERPCLAVFPNSEKRVENTSRSGVFLVSFKVFRNECLIYQVNRN